MRKNSQAVLLALLLLASWCGVYATKFKKQKRILPKEWRDQWSFIPGGKAALAGDTLMIQEFFMACSEVTNQQYKTFLTSLKTSPEAFAKYNVDSTVWVRELKFGEPFQQYYFSHPAYARHPVVGVSYEGAEAYCKWLQSSVQAEVGDGYAVTCKLPNHHEWLRAARGDRHGFVYVWGGPYIQNALGRVLCNYCVIGDQSLSRPIGNAQVEVHAGASLGVAGYLNDNADITAVGISYSPSVFGCYNMNGNVAELVEGGHTAVGGSWRNTGYDVRCESTMPFVGPNCYVGFRPMLRITPLHKS